MSDYFYELTLAGGAGIVWSGAATIHAAATVGASGLTPQQFDAVSISGAATLSVPAAAVVQAGASISSTTSVTAATTLFVQGVSRRTGVSVVSVAAGNESPGIAAIAGAGTVSAVGIGATLSLAGIAGSGTVGVNTIVNSGANKAGIIGTATVGVTTIERAAARATIAGAGAVIPSASHTPTAAATIAGAGLVGTLALGVSQQSGTVAVPGSASVSVAATTVYFAGVARLAGTASVATPAATEAAQASATIAGLSSISAPSPQALLSATVTIQTTLNSFSSDFSSDFGSNSHVSASALEIAQARASVSGAAIAGASATGGSAAASARISGAGAVRAVGITRQQATAGIAGAGTVGSWAGIPRQASARISGVGTSGSNATRAAAQLATKISATASVRVNAGVYRTADPDFHVFFHVGVDAHLGSAQGVDVPTELELDALTARVAALETTGIGAVTAPGQPFYCVEISAGRGATSVYTATRGFGTRPQGAVARRTTVVQALTKLFASDMGYRTGPLDPQGVVPYPPLVQSAFTISRHINLDPTQNAIGASWGSIVLANAGRQLDGYAANWNNDGRDLVIRRGIKNFDSDRGYFVDPNIANLTTVFQGLTTQWTLDQTSLNVPIIDASYWLSRPYQTGFFGGTGSYDGTATLRGVPQPRTRGGTEAAPVHNVTPVLMDPVNRIYQYSDSRGTVVNLYEGGAAVFGYAGDTNNLYAGSTPPGEYRSDNSRSLFQLGSTPVAQITADVTGEFPVAGPIVSAAQIIYYMMTEDMGVPEQYVDSASFIDFLSGSEVITVAAIDRGFGTRSRGALARRTVVPSTAEAAAAIAGMYFDGSGGGETGLTVIASMLASIAAHIVPTRIGLLHMFLLRALQSNATPRGTLDTSNLVGLTPQPMPGNLLPMPYRFRVGYAHNYSVQTSGASVLASDGQRQFMASSDRYATWISPTIQGANLRPNDPAPVGGALLQFGDAQSVANVHGAIWGTRRRIYNAEMPVSLALQYELGDVVKTVYPMDDLSSGRIGQIVGEDFVSTSSTATLQVLI